MAKKKLGDTGDFKPKSIDKAGKKIGDYREGRRFSPRVPAKGKPKLEENCGEIEIPDYTRNNKNVGRKAGDAVLYSGEQIENYKRQYPRFEAALKLVPDAIATNDAGHTVYSFCSKRSPTGYWEVTLMPALDGSYIYAGPPLQILCPVPFHIEQVESDGKTFAWTQVTGRSAIVDPPTIVDPVLHILDDARAAIEPIRFKIALADQPEISDTLTIYTTPTSDYDGLSYGVAGAGVDIDAARKVTTLRPAAPLPLYRHRAYAVNAPGTYMLTWDLPSGDQAFLTETIWQRNTTGAYLDVQQFSKGGDRIFTASLNTHYRILSVYSVYGNESSIDSQRFYFTSGNRVVAADDSLDGLSYTGLRSQITTLPLGRIGRSFEDDLDGVSYTDLKASVTSLPLGRKLLQPTVDTVDGISFVGLKSTIEKYQLGGMVIS